MAQTSFKKRLQRIDGRLAFDIFVRIILGLFFAFSAGMYCKNALGKLQGLDFSDMNPATLSSGLAILSASIYTLTIASLYVLRLRPVNKFAGIWPSLAALLGGFLMFGLILFEIRTDLPLGVQVFASSLVIIGNIFLIYSLSNLGRSFSILPESRKLVTSGPYQYIRHPLYVSEFIVTVGTMISFLSVGAVALVAAQTAFQLVRIHYEEKVLTRNFSEYKKYAQRTARLIPGVY